MRTMMWLWVAIVLAVGSAHAQVAAPNLTPATAGLQALRNPAVQSWERTRILGGFGNAEVSQPTNAVDPVADGEATLLQGNWVGETFSATAEATSTSLDADPNAGLPVETFETDVTRLGLAARFAGAFSLGIGSESVEETGLGTEETTLEHIGGTARVGEVFFVGVSYGTATTTVTGQDDVEQDEYHAGAGVMWGEGMDAVHLEAYTGNRELIIGPPGADEVQTTGFTAEALWSGVLIGYESLTAETSDATQDTGEDEASTLSIGWVPEQGVAIVIQNGTLEQRDAAGDVTVESEATVVSVGWMF